MPGVGAALLGAFYTVGVAIAGTFGISLAGSFALAMALGGSAIGLFTANIARSRKLRDSGDGPTSHQVLVRSTTESRKIVYGRTLVSGPLVFMDSAGEYDEQLYAVIALAAHECEAFVEFHIDDKIVPIADVDTGGDGDVDADTNSHGYGPVGSTPVMYLREHLGSASQTVDTMLDSAFTEWTSDHRGREVCYLVARMDKFSGTEETVWLRGPPQNIAAVLDGKKVYDPRLDSTFTGAVFGSGSGTHRTNDPTTWEWSDNPALCLVDYLTDTKVGAKWPHARIDYDSVAVAAEQCDELVDIPTATTEKRFTCNGVLLCSDNHAENIESLLSAMGGDLCYFDGLWRVYASMWRAPSFSIGESDVFGTMTYRKEPERTERFNAVRGLYFDPQRGYRSSEFIPVEDATLQSDRDDDLVLWKDLDLPLTNSEYMAQRLAFRALHRASRTGSCMIQTGYNAMDIALDDLGEFTNESLGWSDKTFRALGLRYLDMAGVEIAAIEDDEEAYDDPLEGDYGVRDAAGAITAPDFSLPTTGLVIDPMFSRPIGESWFDFNEDGGVDIVSGGGENGSNALELEDLSIGTPRAAACRRMREVSVGETLGGDVRVMRTNNWTIIQVGVAFYRADTMAFLGVVNDNITADLVSAATWYTVPWSIVVNEAYTLAAGVRLLAQVVIDATPNGSGTATLTFSSISARRGA